MPKINADRTAPKPPARITEALSQMKANLGLVPDAETQFIKTPELALMTHATAETGTHRMAEVGKRLDVYGDAFAKADLNHDGAISTEERQKAVSALKEYMALAESMVTRTDGKMPSQAEIDPIMNAVITELPKGGAPIKQIGEVLDLVEAVARAYDKDPGAKTNQ